MMVQGVSISQMLNQSITCLTKPSVATFEQFEKRGGTREALIYVAVAAAIVAVVAAIFTTITSSLLAGLVSLVGGFLVPFIGFLVFAYALYWMGKQQGGTGTQDEVFYTIALYAAPILAVNGALGNIPVIACLYLPIGLALTIYQIYLAYLAARSSMNIDQNKAIISVVLAIVAQWIVFFIIGGIVGAISVALGVSTGTIDIQS